MNVLCAGLPAVLKAMTAAATIAVTGQCGPYVEIDSVSPGVVLDFSSAVVSRLDLAGVKGPLTIKGFFSSDTEHGALNIHDSNQIFVDGPHCGAPGNACVIITRSDRVEIKGLLVSRSNGDGIDIAGSTNVVVHDGRCEDNQTPVGDHPDCVQMWTLPSHPLRHITVQRMVARGNTQGFDNFGPNVEDESDIKALDNTAAITTANCVVFKGVKDLVVTGNRCITLPGGKVGRAAVRVLDSPGAVVRDNRQQ